MDVIYYVIVDNDGKYYRQIGADGEVDFNPSVDYAIKLTNESLAIQLAETLSVRYNLRCHHEQIRR